MSEEEILDIKRENYKLRKENFELIQDNAKLQEDIDKLNYRLREKICMEAEIKSDLGYVLEQTKEAFTDIRKKYKFEE